MHQLHNPELYLPATDGQLRSFTHKLDRIVERFSGTAEPWGLDEIDLAVNISLSESEKTRIHFSSQSDGDVDTYVIEFSTMQAIRRSTYNDETIDMLFGDDFRYCMDPQQEPEVELPFVNAFASNTVYAEMPEADDVIGFRGHQNNYLITKDKRSINAAKSTIMHMYDADIDCVNSHIAHMRYATLVNIEEQILELVRLYNNGEPVFDAEIREHDLNVPTPADLIICTNGLIRAGLLNKGTCAYKGAGPFMEHLALLMPTIHTI